MDFKQQAASHALDIVQNGMVVGLGSGSTTAYFIKGLGDRLRAGRLQEILGVPTSKGAAVLAQSCGIPLTSLSEQSGLDMAVDGADEVDPRLNLIKGLGRALLREKVIEIHARQLVVIVDETKLVERLGTKGPLPVEILPFEAGATIRWLNQQGCRAELWCEDDGQPVVTDNQNYLVRCWFEGSPSEKSLQGIPDPFDLARKLADRPGVVEHGLFLEMANRVIVAGVGGINILERQLSTTTR